MTEDDGEEEGEAAAGERKGDAATPLSPSA
jgi:hypothetical protein